MSCELIDPELDAFIAEKVMGWKVWQDKRDDWVVDFTKEGENCRETLKQDYPLFDPYTGRKREEKKWWELNDSWDLPMNFTQDLNLCCEAEEALVILPPDLEFKYICALVLIMDPSEKGHDFGTDHWYFVYKATARQRCEAMWEVLKDA